eukprot:TRINITY_DN6818_c0_g1_i1.p1 TRINITY_DN6818_c0_g1~~TRINITY_DN6818_c0_g1_i1.p1  ORF type:complete len:426 (+),score=67.07 TRINITY_DN6818_c0_g1_i1:114-1280(+)
MVLPAEPATEQTYFEPYGVTHKLLGETLLLPWIQAPAIANRSQTWRCGTGDKTPLSPGLFPSIGQSIRALEAFFFLAGDPVRDYERDMTCPFMRARLFEFFVANDPSGSWEAREDHTVVAMLPPWHLPLADSQPAEFGKKVVVFMSDPRYLVMRMAAMRARIEQCASIHETTPAELSRSDFLATYLSSELHLVGEAMQRLAVWALEEERQPDKVNIFFVDDFVAEPEIALRGLARFLGVPDFGEEFAAAAKLLSATGKTGTFHPRADFSRPESQDSLVIVQEFEEVFAELPGDLQATWAANAERWQTLPTDAWPCWESNCCRTTFAQRLIGGLHTQLVCADHAYSLFNKGASDLRTASIAMCQGIKSGATGQAKGSVLDRREGFKGHW